jgi:cytochrome c oxidase subunit 2
MHLNHKPDLSVNVIGYQWGWQFQYPAQHVTVQETNSSDTPTLVLPTNEWVHLKLTTRDVNHAFFVPGFLTKRDLIQGVNNVIELHPDRTGTYVGNCAEFCGIDHARMHFNVRVVTPADFDQWAAKAK